MRYDPAWLGSDPLPQLIDGRESREGGTHPVVDPSTGETPARYAEATAAEVEAALAAARRSHDEGEWRRMPAAVRAELLEAAATAIRADARRLAVLEALDTGRAIGGVLMNDVYEAAGAFSHAAAVARAMPGDVRRSAFPPEPLPGSGPELLTMRLRAPAGVVVELLPWNGPLMTGGRRIAMALAAGCSIVAKPPEEAVVTLVELGRVLTRAGLPAGVLNIVLGSGETVGEQLVTDPRVDLVSLTGGPETGRRVMESAARNRTPTHLNLRGKSPVIVFADADLDQAVRWATMAAFVNTGEGRVAGNRLLVEEPVYDDVVKGVAEAAANLRVGDALDPATLIGPLISVTHANRVRELVSRAVSSGDATVVGAPSVPCSSRATYVPPTVLGRVRPGGETERHEVFGPVLAATPFSSEEEALALANGAAAHGLSGTVFTRDIERACRFADALDCGEVDVNRHFSPDWNGPRHAGVDAYTRLKTVNIRTRP
ncbi:aldehyde dehydrogenase family protein [Sphaerimonospora mesophila]|uniref:aldehyde dehydrogenase family protein n=1 Tax=Sphaerimonospora mesophila TaxID=37483 RepID=UPI0006E4082A